MSLYRVGDYMVIYGTGGPRAASLAGAPTLTPVALNARTVVTGHSIPDAIFDWPWMGVPQAAGTTGNVWSGTGPYATAGYRWDSDPAGPDAVRALLTAGGSNSYDLFLGIEAHGGVYEDGRASVAAHIEFSDAYGYALLWHNLAASKGCQTFYANFWRNDAAELWGSSWRASCNLEAPLWDGIIDYVNANRAGGTPAMRLVPWLQVFMAIYDAIQAGTVTGVTMGDFFADDVHCDTINGRWVQMATVMAVMFKRHPNEMPNSVPLEFGGTDTINSTLATQLRPIIWATCIGTARAGLS